MDKNASHTPEFHMAAKILSNHLLMRNFRIAADRPQAGTAKQDIRHIRALE